MQITSAAFFLLAVISFIPILLHCAIATVYFGTIFCNRTGTVEVSSHLSSINF